MSDKGLVERELLEGLACIAEIEGQPEGEKARALLSAQAQAAPDEAVAYQFEERVWVQGGGGSIWREQLEVHEPDQDQREVRNLIALYAHSAPPQPHPIAAQSAPDEREGSGK